MSKKHTKEPARVWLPKLLKEAGREFARTGRSEIRAAYGTVRSGARESVGLRSLRRR